MFIITAIQINCYLSNNKIIHFLFLINMFVFKIHFFIKVLLLCSQRYTLKYTLIFILIKLVKLFHTISYLIAVPGLVESENALEKFIFFFILIISFSLLLKYY